MKRLEYETQRVQYQFPMEVIQMIEIYKTSTNSTATKTVIDCFKRGFIEWALDQEEVQV